MGFYWVIIATRPFHVTDIKPLQFGLAWWFVFASVRPELQVCRRRITKTYEGFWAA
jgi:hypothetical protein